MSLPSVKLCLRKFSDVMAGGLPLMTAKAGDASEGYRIPISPGLSIRHAKSQLTMGILSNSGIQPVSHVVSIP